MSNIYKKLYRISIIIFLSIEFIFFPLTNFIYSLLQNNNHIKSIGLINFTNQIDFYIILLTIELILLLINFYCLNKLAFRSRYYKYVLKAITIILILTNVFILYSVYIMKNGIGL